MQRSHLEKISTPSKYKFCSRMVWRIFNEIQEKLLIATFSVISSVFIIFVSGTIGEYMEFHSLYSSPDIIIRVIKLRGMRWAERVV
jgi:hypothetical protein